jgi:hypothetical protein
VEKGSYGIEVSGQSALLGEQGESRWGIGNRNGNGGSAVDDGSGTDRKGARTSFGKEEVLRLTKLQATDGEGEFAG